MEEEEDLKSARKRGTYVGAILASLIIGLPSLGTSVTAFLNTDNAIAADSRAKDPIIEGLLIDIRMCTEYVAETEARLIGLERTVYDSPEMAAAATKGIHVEVPDLASHAALHNLMVAVARAKGLPTAVLDREDFVEAPVVTGGSSSAISGGSIGSSIDFPVKTRKRQLKMEPEQLQLPKRADINMAF